MTGSSNLSLSIYADRAQLLSDVLSLSWNPFLVVCLISVLLFILFASITFAMMKYVDFSGTLGQSDDHSTGADEHRLPPHCGRPQSSLNTTCLSGESECKLPTMKAQRARVAINGCAESCRQTNGPTKQPDYGALGQQQVGLGSLKQSISDNCLNQLAGTNQVRPVSYAMLDGTLPRNCSRAQTDFYAPIYLQSDGSLLTAGHAESELADALLVEPPPELASLLLTNHQSSTDTSAATRQLFVPVSGDQTGARNLHGQRHLQLTGAQGGPAHTPAGQASTIVFNMPTHVERRQTWQSSSQVIDGLVQAGE